MHVCTCVILIKITKNWNTCARFSFSILCCRHWAASFLFMTMCRCVCSNPCSSRWLAVAVAICFAIVLHVRFGRRVKLCANEEKHEFNWAKERRVWYVCIESVRESLCWSNRAIPKLGFVSNGCRRRRRPCKNQVLFRWVPYLPFRQHLNFKLCRRCYSKTIHKHTHSHAHALGVRRHTHAHTYQV